MTDYNANVIHEQGGSVLRVKSGGSISVSTGGVISGAGKISTTGDITTTSKVEGASLTVSAAGALYLGPSVQVMFAASTAAPSGLPVTASPGAVFFRVDGANSAAYMNTGDDLASSAWTIFSELAG